MPSSRPPPDSSPHSSPHSSSYSSPHSSPHSSPPRIHAQRLAQRPELLGGVGAAGELGEVLGAHRDAGLAHLFGCPCVDRVHELFEWYAPSVGERIGGIESRRGRLHDSAPRGECRGGGLRRRTRLRRHRRRRCARSIPCASVTAPARASTIAPGDEVAHPARHPHQGPERAAARLVERAGVHREPRRMHPGTVLALVVRRARLHQHRIGGARPDALLHPHQPVHPEVERRRHPDASAGRRVVGHRRDDGGAPVPELAHVPGEQHRVLAAGVDVEGAVDGGVQVRGPARRVRGRCARGAWRARARGRARRRGRRSSASARPRCARTRRGAAHRPRRAARWSRTETPGRRRRRPEGSRGSRPGP